MINKDFTFKLDNLFHSRINLMREATLPPIKLMNSRNEDSYRENSSRASTDYISTSLIPKTPKFKNQKRSSTTIGEPIKQRTADTCEFKTSHVVVEVLEQGSIFVNNFFNCILLSN